MLTQTKANKKEQLKKKPSADIKTNRTKWKKAIGNKTGQNLQTINSTRRRLKHNYAGLSASSYYSRVSALHCTETKFLFRPFGWGGWWVACGVRGAAAPKFTNLLDAAVRAMSQQAFSGACYNRSSSWKARTHSCLVICNFTLFAGFCSNLPFSLRCYHELFVFRLLVRLLHGSNGSL